MATHSSILAWRIPWTEELGGLQSTGRKESDTTERLHSLSGFIVYILKLSVYLQMMLNHFMYQKKKTKPTKKILNNKINSNICIQ